MGTSHSDRCTHPSRRRKLSATFVDIPCSSSFYRPSLLSETLSDSSSSSTDIKLQQLGRPMSFSPSPSMSSVPMMLSKHSKTPSHEHPYGSVPSAALVPQTDLQPRHQQRRRRNSSSSSSGIRRPGTVPSPYSLHPHHESRSRLALFGKPSDYFFSRHVDYAHDRDTGLSNSE